MQIRIFDRAEQASQAAAMVIAAQLIRNPHSVLGMPTGSTPVPVYRELIRMYQQGLISFAKATSFNLDEYCGLAKEHKCSYHRFMREELFDHVDIPENQFHLPDGKAADFVREGREYDEAIARAGGIDMQFLGIGLNGHIGFNEPAKHFAYDTYVVDLTPETIEANARFFDEGEEVPKQAITVGVGGIMAARQIVLVATGAEKADIIHRSLRGDIRPEIPATILQMHPNVLLLLDQAASGKL